MARYGRDGRRPAGITSLACVPCTGDLDGVWLYVGDTFGSVARHHVGAAMLERLGATLSTSFAADGLGEESYNGRRILQMSASGHDLEREVRRAANLVNEPTAVSPTNPLTSTTIRWQAHARGNAVTCLPFRPPLRTHTLTQAHDCQRSQCAVQIP